MDAIMTLLTDNFGPFGPLLAVGGLGLVLVLATLPTLMKKRIDPLDKLKKSRVEPNEGKESLRSAVSNANAKKDKLEKYKAFLEPKNAEEYSAMQLTLLQAGYPGKNAVRTFHFAQMAMGIGFLILGVGYAILKSSAGDPSTQQTMMSIIIPGAVGYMAPKYWVTRRVEARKEEIQNGFPDALDMLLVCVEAGQSLDQGIIRVAKELRAAYPAMSEEFETVSHEIKAGKDKAQVLRTFGERSGVPDVASFVTVMIQSQQFGTSIAEALRLYAADMRDKRIMRAEEAANKIPTKMTLGTMMFTVPPLLIILVGPSVHDMLENFKAIGL